MVTGPRPVIDHHLGGAEQSLAAPVPTLEYLEDGVVGLGRVVALRNRFMLGRVERLANDLP